MNYNFQLKIINHNNILCNNKYLLYEFQNNKNNKNNMNYLGILFKHNGFLNKKKEVYNVNTSIKKYYNAYTFLYFY